MRGESIVSTPCILELQHLTKYFGGIRANEDINLKIGEGELHCLIGPNGAGKSTVFRMITGEYSPTRGNILFKGHNITHEKTWRRIRRGISIKLQVPGVFSELSMRDNIKIALRNRVLHKTENEETDRLCQLVGIDNLGDPLVKNMSHGQQQWLEIGMALASTPKLLLLDEPAAGLGPEETEFTAELVKKIQISMGVTVIFIDHDMNFVRKIASRVTVLHLGKIFAEGTMQEIEANEHVRQIYLGDL